MTNRTHNPKRGLSLAELLVASAVMGIICLSFGTLAMSVQMANEYSQEKNLVGQHARVILQRIERTMQGAHATESFPGILPITYYYTSYDFPQAVAIWDPAGDALSSYPQVSELVLFAIDPQNPNQLLEIRNKLDTRTAPGLADEAGWRTLVADLIDSSDSEIVEISDLLRAGKAGSNYYSTLRFQTRVVPSDADIAAARAGSLDWEDLNWATSIYSSKAGVRQVWCHFEWQLVPSSDVSQHSGLREQAVPFFGSSAIYYQVTK
ncbi:hypothetical protein C5Y96_21265 [Blastopirellula marina]|uniref:Uncharacterized protein n=1 Tax=Blastopirellula marina TaxID=124 RepID=A0A2S8F1H5_9BACT|nr:MULTISPECIES: hypothetical protein [Pirellulaceae]PQO25983.1 hypothetical protein C5Y96_21265 [Blastopirellula marina]RCS44341.1 hypothetical protein DTL36_21310 [Bremerella cremea]